MLEPAGVSTVGVAETIHATPTADLVVLRQGDRVWLGNVSHPCLTEITGYGRAGDVIWQAAPPHRRRQAF